MKRVQDSESGGATYDRGTGIRIDYGPGPASPNPAAAIELARRSAAIGAEDAARLLAWEQHRTATRLADELGQAAAEQRRVADRIADAYGPPPDEASAVRFAAEVESLIHDPGGRGRY